mgnify:CR=1 FL=1
MALRVWPKNEDREREKERERERLRAQSLHLNEPVARKLPIVTEAIFLALQKPADNGKKFARAKHLI